LENASTEFTGAFFCTDTSLKRRIILFLSETKMDKKRMLVMWRKKLGSKNMEGGVLPRKRGCGRVPS
jgi:hypothetical protein